MSTKSPNPLEIFNIRREEFLPVYFETVSLRLNYNMKDSIKKWIDNNLKGRYYINVTVDLVDNSVTNVVKVGFEEPKEMSYFMLACPHLKYK